MSKKNFFYLLMSKADVIFNPESSHFSGRMVNMGHGNAYKDNAEHSGKKKPKTKKYNVFELSLQGYSIFLFLFLTSIFITFFAFHGSAIKVPPQSARRQKRIHKIINNYLKAEEDLTDPDVREAIFKDIAEFCPLEPTEKPDLRTTSDLAAIVSKLIKKKFPKSALEIRREAETIASRKFKMEKLMNRVTVRYRKGYDLFSASGIFYGYGIGGNSIKIGSQIIALFDLLPEYRVKFDKAFCEQKKKEFIERKIKEYYTKKNLYSFELFSKLRKSQIENNEKSGYIYIGGEWHSAKEVAEIFIRTKIGVTGEEAQESVAAITKPDKEEKDEKVKLPDKEKEKKLTVASVTKKAKEKLLQIRRTNAGIDADQGYLLATWGMSHKEVNLLFPKFFSPDDTSNPAVIDYSEGPIQGIELWFFHDIFYKVVVNFRLGPIEAMQVLSKQLHERYGLTEEERAARMKAIAAASGKTDKAENADVKKNKGKNKDKNKKTKQAKNKKKDKKKGKKKGKKKPPPKPALPLKTVVHWKGNYTVGTLTVTLNKERTAFTEFTLIKEHPTLRQQIEKKIEEEKKKREAMERKKELEQFKKPIEF